LFTLEWTHPPNREQPDGAADLLNTNSHSQYYSLQRSWIKSVIPLSTAGYTRYARVSHSRQWSNYNIVICSDCLLQEEGRDCSVSWLCYKWEPYLVDDSLILTAILVYSLLY